MSDLILMAVAWLLASLWTAGETIFRSPNVPERERQVKHLLERGQELLDQGRLEEAEH
jgi:hypothetical protein